MDNALKKLRLEYNHTQQSLSDLTGLSPNYISELERGKKTISLDIVTRYAIALEMRVVEVFELLEKEFNEENTKKKSRKKNKA